MIVDYKKLSQLSIADLSALKDRASLQLSIATLKPKTEDSVAYWTFISATCINELNDRMSQIFKQEYDDTGI